MKKPPFLELTYYEGETRRTVKEDLVNPVLVDDKDPDKSFLLFRAVHGGGNGVVFQAACRSKGRLVQQVAVKLLRQLNLTSRDRFANERRILAGLSQASIAALFGGGTYRVEQAAVDVPWLAMDLCGPNLRQHVARFGPLPPPVLRNVAYQMCDALQYVHERDLIHRDVKPANVVWAADDDGKSGRVKLIDFGLAKYSGEDVSARPLDDFTKTMDFVGPVFFSSPELIAYAEDKAHPVDHRSDLFQLGKTLWFVATGRILAGIPSGRHDPTEGRLYEVVCRLIADDPSDRPESANVVKAMVETW